MTIKIIKAQITTQDEKGHIKHLSQKDSKSIHWRKALEVIVAGTSGAPIPAVTNKKKDKKKD